MIKQVLLVAWKPKMVFQSLLEKRKKNLIYLIFLFLFAQLLVIQLTTPIIVKQKIKETSGIIENKLLSQSQIEIAIYKARFIYSISGVIGWCLSVLFISFIILEIGKFFLNSRIKFYEALLIVLYSSVVDLWSYIIKVPLILFKQSTKIYFSFAALSTDTFSFTGCFLKYLDILIIWKFIIIGIGMSVFYKEEEKVKKYVLIGILLVITYSFLLSLIMSSLYELKMSR